MNRETGTATLDREFASLCHGRCPRKMLQEDHQYAGKTAEGREENTFLSKALNKGKDDEMGTPMDSLQTPDLSRITDHSFGDFPTLTEGYNFLLLLKW